MREGQVDHGVGLALGGWTNAAGQQSDAAYGQGYSVHALHGGIAKVAFPKLDLRHLLSRDVEGAPLKRGPKSSS